MLFYGIALRLYGFIVVHLFGLWLLVQQVVSFCNGDPPKKFNFVRQEQKVFVVTGGTRGIGRKVAERLMALGAFVVITGRRSVNDPSIQRTLEELSALSSRYKYVQVDFVSMEETVRICDFIKASYDHLDGLVCNAAIMGAPYRLTPEGFESQQAVNYLSTTVLVDQLKSLLKPGQGRIIFVASAIHRLNYCNINDFDFSEGYCPYLAYAQSKLALITYACSTGPSLLEHHGLTLNSVHPGIVNTDLYRNKLVRLLAYLVFSSPTNAAESVLFPLLSTTFEGVTGQYMEGFEIVPPSAKVRAPEFADELYQKTQHLVGPWLSPPQAE